MHVRKLVTLALLSLVVSAVGAVAGDSGLIRIEPRLFYGATVTMESGVRVWRPLPPTRQMIINPTNAPVNVHVADVRERITNHNHNYVHGAPTGAPAYANSGGYYHGGTGYYGRPFAGRAVAGQYRSPRAAGLGFRRSFGGRRY